MKLFFRSQVIQATFLLLGVSGFLRAADVSGKWKSEFESQVGAFKYSYQLKVDGDKITGVAVRDLGGQVATNNIIEGTIKADAVSFVEVTKIQDQDVRIEYTGKIAGDEMKLTRKVGDFGTAEIVATREKEMASSISVAGQWQSEFDSQVGHQKYVYTFKLEGDTLSGTAVREVEDQKTTSDLKGKVTGADISFTEPLKVQDQDLTIEYSGKINGDEIKLTRKVGDFATTEIVAHRLKKEPDAK
jgi:DNA-directed RNA polymerase subunit H (RpoH/RPB5)